MSSRLLISLAALGLVVSFGKPVEASYGFALLPGSVAGDISSVGVKRGESARWVAMRYGVHPSRVHAGDGYGSLSVDMRHVVPAFDPTTSGIVLNIPEAEVYYVHDGEIDRHYPVAVSAPDKPMPIGTTRVVAKQKNPPWFIPTSIQKEMGKRGHKPAKTVVPPGPKNPLGPRWIGVWNGSYGFHGTNVPTSIKQYASHGCVRFRAGDIKDLYDRVSLGTPVHVVYQPVVMGVDDTSIWLQVYPDIYKKGYDYKGAVASLARMTGMESRVNWKAVARAIARPTGVITNIGPGGGFRGYEDPTAANEETQVVEHGSAHAIAHKVARPPAPKPSPTPRYIERLIPEDDMQQRPAGDPVVPAEGNPGPWFTQP